METIVCRVCGHEKPTTSFDRVGQKKDGTFYYRKKCHQCRWPTKKKWRQKTRDYVTDIKKQSSCLDCGLKDHRVLEFHHRAQKDGNIGDMARHASIKNIKAEIEKCDILCANCHRIRHYDEIERDMV